MERDAEDEESRPTVELGVAVSLGKRQPPESCTHAQRACQRQESGKRKARRLSKSNAALNKGATRANGLWCPDSLTPSDTQ